MTSFCWRPGTRVASISDRNKPFELLAGQRMTEMRVPKWYVRLSLFQTVGLLLVGDLWSRPMTGVIDVVKKL
jgi:hypothetical protein